MNRAGITVSQADILDDYDILRAWVNLHNITWDEYSFLFTIGPTNC